MAPKLTLLVVDDDSAIRLSLEAALEADGHRVTAVGDIPEAIEAVTRTAFDVVVADIHLPHGTGLELFRAVRRESPDTDVILITGHGAISEAVAALKDGARDYLTKPFAIEELVVRIDRIAEQRAIKQELVQARTRLQATEQRGLISRAPTMVRINERITTMAESEAPVLISGESGTGKELVARLLHQQSSRIGKPFVAVNCAAFPDTLIEAELFGHERGAFTGAVQKRDGRFKAADGGTLFLDEVAEIPLPAQAKLLRILQEGMVEPIGTNTPIPVNVRIVSATHRNLKRQILEGKFREDLYYRINVLNIHIPPLRERQGDLPLLIGYFLSSLTPNGKPQPTISPRAYAALAEYPFPGNIRELKHAIEHAVVLARGQEIDLEHLPEDIAGAPRPTEKVAGPTGPFYPLSAAVKEFEREYLLRALDRANGKKSEAAALLGISRKNLWEKLRAYGIGPSNGTAQELLAHTADSLVLNPASARQF
jgi:DNA-binding NtrC family response regulator